MKLNVLDHGYVELLDVMGSDKDVVEAAFISTGNDPENADIESAIYNLIYRGHMSPFEMAELKFKMRMPIFTHRQHVRHRTASMMERSGRYTTLDVDTYVPEDRCDDGSIATITSINDVAKESYEEMLNDGISKEISRIVLPLSTYVDFIWKIDLRNLLHYLELRLDPHAQYEIRQYANAISKFVEMNFPHTWNAFEDVILNRVTLTGRECNIISELFDETDDIVIFNEITNLELKRIKTKLRKLLKREVNVESIRHT